MYLHTIIPFCTWIVTSVSEPGFTSPELGLTLYFSGDVVFTCQRNTNIYSTGCFTLVIITWNICSCFRQYLMRGLICHLSKSSIRPSIYFSLKSWNLAGNPFMKPTQFEAIRVYFFEMLQGNNRNLWWGSNPWLTDYKSDALPTAPRCPLTD